jgi:two-component system response regulator YesN
MKILIADDEKIARITLMSMLSELKMAMTIYEASDGEMFLEKVQEHAPQIAFVDIKMPKLDGLKAIKKASLLSPGTKWIILTAYSEFDFAKQALELKAFQYLLKPVNPRKLAETMEAALVDYRRELINNNIQFERNIISIYNNLNAENSLSYLHFAGGTAFQGGIIYGDGSDPNAFQLKKNELFHKTRILLEEYLDNQVRIALFNTPNEKMLTLCAYSAKSGPGSRDKVAEYFNGVESLIKSLITPSLSIILLKGAVFTSKDDIRCQIAQIEELGPLRVMFGKKTDYRLLGLKKDGRLTEYLTVCQNLIKLCEYFQQKKYLHYQDTVKYLVKELRLESLLVNKEFMQNITAFLAFKGDIHLEADLNVQKWLETLLNYEGRLIVPEKKNSCYIDEIITYVEENYMNDIGINTIALALNLSPNYLSSIFHKKTQKRFTDYLTEVRIAKAKELLRETDLHVKDIAQKVGYYSTRHFTKLFFKYVNCYPSEYKELLKNNATV